MLYYKLTFLYSCDSQVGCPVVAALLHYFLLALFSWMLCEGVHLYLSTKLVGGAGEKIKYFYMFGWGRFVFGCCCCTSVVNCTMT